VAKFFDFLAEIEVEFLFSRAEKRAGKVKP
jgi:hypothetical protein